MFNDPDVEARLVIERILVRPRRRQFWLEYLPRLWFTDPDRTRYRSPARVTREAIGAVTECLRDERDHVRLAALVALRRPAPHFEVAAGAVIAALTDRFLDVRIAAANALIHYGEARHEAIELLRGCTLSPSRRLRCLAARTLAEISPQESDWDTLYDAASNDPKGFPVWLDGLYAMTQAGIRPIEDLLNLKERVRAAPQRFRDGDPLPRERFDDLWIDLLATLESFDGPGLAEARMTFDTRLRGLLKGNVYAKLVDSVVGRVSISE